MNATALSASPWRTACAARSPATSFAPLPADPRPATTAFTAWRRCCAGSHPELGLLLPDRVHPAGRGRPASIIPIGTWVLRDGLPPDARWHDAASRRCVAVNLSARQFQQPDLVERGRGRLDETGLPRRCLELEITESRRHAEPETHRQTLRELKALGVRISIDDFGTGYSSLSYLKRFPIDTLKIDQSFVRDITTDRTTPPSSSAIIAMAHSLKLKVVAEGVETDEQLAFLPHAAATACRASTWAAPSRTTRSRARWGSSPADDAAPCTPGVHGALSDPRSSVPAIDDAPDPAALVVGDVQRAVRRLREADRAMRGRVGRRGAGPGEPVGEHLARRRTARRPRTARTPRCSPAPPAGWRVEARAVVRDEHAAAVARGELRPV